MLFYFILGVAFISIGIPLFEGISSFIQSYFEYLVYERAIKIYKIKKEIGLVQEEEEEEEENNPIGFTYAIGQEIQNTEEEDSDDDDNE